MTTTQDLANRLQRHTLVKGHVGVDPITIITIVQILAQAALACMPEPDGMVKWINGKDFPVITRVFPRIMEARRAHIRNIVKHGWQGSPEALPDLLRAIETEASLVTVDEMVDLYADNKQAV